MKKYLLPLGTLAAALLPAVAMAADPVVGTTAAATGHELADAAAAFDMKDVAVALVMGFGAIGPAIGIGIIGGKSVEAIGRNPESAAKVQTAMILTAAFAEAVAIYALVVALIIKFV